MSALPPFPCGRARCTTDLKMTAFVPDHQNKAEVCALACVCVQACAVYVGVRARVMVQHSPVAGLGVKLCINELRLH